MKRFVAGWLLISAFLTGCIADYSVETYIPSDLRIDIDSDNTLFHGYVAVSDQEYIYYFGQEDSKQGIYRMDKDGNNVKFIAEEKDISEMQLVDNTLYYLSFDSVFYGDTSRGDGIGSKVYTLKSIDLNNGKINDFDEYESRFQDYFQEYHYNFERGIVGFYYCGNDQFLLSTVDLAVPTKRLELLTGIVTREKILEVDEAFQEHNIKGKEMPFPSCNIYTNDFVVMITDWDQIDYMDGLINSNNLYLFEKGTGSSCESAGAEFDKKPYTKVSVSTLEENQVIYTINNYVVKCELENNTILKYMEIPDAERNSIINNKYILAYNNDQVSQTLYRFISEDFTYEEIFNFKDEKVVSIFDDFILSITNNFIKKYVIHDNSIEEIWSKKLKENYLKSDFSIELCNGWLFIKQFDIDKEGAYLVEKIRID